MFFKYLFINYYFIEIFMNNKIINKAETFEFRIACFNLQAITPKPRQLNWRLYYNQIFEKNEILLVWSSRHFSLKYLSQQ